MEIVIHNVTYKVIRDVKDAIQVEDIEKALTDYFDSFDYILGDYAYGKLRLKGFNEKTNKNFKPYNDYKNIEEYILKNCAYGCRYFIISRVTPLK